MVHETVFNGQVFVVEAGETSSPTVILVHGMGEAGLTDWLTVIPALENQYHVIAMDLPGFGRSDAPVGKYSPTNYARVLQQIKQRFSPNPVHVVGHSMGGAAALRYSMLYPNDIEDVVLVDVAGILSRTALLKQRARGIIEAEQMPTILQAATTRASYLVQKILEKLGQLPDPMAARAMYQDLSGRLMGDQANSNAGLALVDEDFTDAIYNNPHRVHVIWGRDDTIAPMRTAKLLQGQLPNGSLEIIDDAGHVPMKSQPQLFNNLLLDALSDNRFGKKSTQVSTQSSAQSLNCNGKRDQKYSGVYKNVIIERCRSVVLKNIVAESLVIKDSKVEMENIHVVSNDVAAVIEHSVVVATNIRLIGQIGILVSRSRLDIAGAQIEASEMGVDATSHSQLIFSISKVDSPNFTGNLHGQFTNGLGELIQK